MRIIFLLFYLALLPVFSSAQVRIGYRYDASGNRVKREIMMPAARDMARPQNQSLMDASFSDKLGNHSIMISPNFTEGSLRISIPGLQEADKCSLEIYTSQGMQVLTRNVRTDNTVININHQPAGIYLLRITVNDNSMTWKITKK